MNCRVVPPDRETVEVPSVANRQTTYQAVNDIATIASRCLLPQP